MDTISLDAAEAVTGISRRTLWRRVTDGTIGRCDTGGRSRAMLALGDVLPLVEVQLSAEDRATLLRADAGDAQAQADMGALFYVAGAHKAALYWLQEAAAQDNADAMQWLGTAYAGGGGVIPQDDNLAIMWLARAAALGHRIAAYQLEQLRAGCR